MKAIVKTSLVMAMLGVGAWGCNSANKSDAQKEANAANEERFDDSDREKDAQFVVDVITGSYDEVRLARTAIEKSKNEQVTSLAEALESSHMEMISELTSLAASKGISIPAEPTERAVEKSKELQQLEGEEDFRESWYKALIERHEKTISDFENAIESATDPDIQMWAVENVPKIRMHLDALKLQKNG